MPEFIPFRTEPEADAGLRERVIRHIRLRYAHILGEHLRLLDEPNGLEKLQRIVEAKLNERKVA